MMQALAEMAVLYPINGAFTMYVVRFVDPSWGFACGWQYAIFACHYQACKVAKQQSY